MKSRTETAPRWTPPPLFYASAAVHVAAAATTCVSPALWPWTVGAVLLNHAAITGAGLWPRSRWLGPNWIRLPEASAARREVALTIDDGPDPEITPRVLALLGAYGARATFFCIGAQVERHPQLAREIVRLGHAVENHSQHHRLTFSLLGPGAIEREIVEAQCSIARITGQTPRFFRAPAGLRNPFLDPVLTRQGLRLATWTRRGFDTVSADSAQVYQRLSRSLAAADILLLHDGHAARGPLGTPVIVEVLPRLLETLRERGLTPVTLRDAAP